MISLNMTLRKAYNASLCRQTEFLRIQICKFATVDEMISEAKNAGKYQKIKTRKEDNKLRRKILEETYFSPGARKYEAVAQSISDRGFCREQVPYKPPEDTENQIKIISQDIFGKVDIEWKDISLEDSYLKYKLLTRCIQHFNHDIPNSLLHKMTKLSDVLEYFLTPVEGILPYDVLVRDSNKLPQNLCVIPNPLRFHPETDTLFGGITAFPKSATIVSGLKSKKKYRGYNPNPPIPKII
ncbi:uncharacterized protein LOC111631870 [Centruroides sculpturatus]|uniref:uncharacterized protein LOC111631870 n=1 Tax=Centruroides sculpturatus TaxID=218467 RepID=UPI000C6D5A08|nr:uncharacterized protein LOC111631870 [Centruroides sculpturatus]